MVTKDERRVGDLQRAGWVHVKFISSGLCLSSRLELVYLANDVPSASTTHNPPPSLLSTTSHQPSRPPPLCFSLCHLPLPSLWVRGACALAELFGTWCQIGGPSACWHTLSQWLETESGEEERARAGEKEGEKRSYTRVCQRSCSVFQHLFGPLVLLVFFSFFCSSVCTPLVHLSASAWLLCRSELHQ